MHDVSVGQTRVRHQPQGEDFPQKHSEAPDVGFRGENAIQESLWRHPLDWKHRFAALAVVIGSVDVPGHAEVGDFHNPPGTLAAKQAVSSSDVAMDEPLAFHVPAPLGHVQRTEDQVLHVERRRTFRFVSAFAQEVLQVTARQQFEDNEPRMPVEADANQVHNVRMVELGHDGGFHQEIRLSLPSRQFRQSFDGHRHLHSVAVTMSIQALVHLAEGPLSERSGI